jgi:hypothetical protein
MFGRVRSHNRRRLLRFLWGGGGSNLQPLAIVPGVFTRHNVAIPWGTVDAQLPPTQKTFWPCTITKTRSYLKIAACLDLTECEIEQIRVETVGLLQTMPGSSDRQKGRH